MAAARRRTHGRTDDRRCAAGARRRTCLRRARRELPADPRCAATTSRDRLAFVTCRHEHGASMMAEAHGKLDGRPGRLPRHPRSRCVQRRDRRAHRLPGFDADAAADRSGRARLSRPRGLPGSRLRGDVPAAGQARRADRRRGRAAGGDGAGRSISPAPGGRGRWSWRCRRTCWPKRRGGGRRAAAAARPDTPPDPGLMERLHRVLGDARRPMMLLGGGGWTEAARADILAFAEANALARLLRLSPQRPVRQRPSLLRGRARHRRQSGAGRAHARGRSAARRRLPARRGDQPGLHPAARRRHRDGPELVHVHPDPAEPGRVFPAALAIAASVPAFARGGAPAGAVPRRRTGGRGRRRRTPTIWPTASLRPGRRCARSGPGDAGTCGGCCRRTRSSPSMPATSPAGRSASCASAAAAGCSAPPTAPWATACRRRSRRKLRHPERMVVGMRRRRRLRHDRPGAGDGRPLTVRRHRPGVRQRHVRHHPHAPGAALSRPRDRHALTNPDFAALARACGAHGERVERTEDFAAAFARAADGRPPGADRAALQPRADHHPHHPESPARRHLSATWRPATSIGLYAIFTQSPDLHVAPL